MKILQVITGLGMGGAETQLASLCEGLAKRGHQVMIVYLTGSCVVTPNDNRIAVHAAGMEKGLLGTVRGFFRLRRSIRAFKPDVVHSHMLHANLLSRLMRVVTSVPCLICTVHSKLETHNKLLKLGYRLTNRLADITSFVSAEAAEVYVQQGLVTRSKALVVYNGIDLNRFSPQPAVRLSMRANFGISADARMLIAIGRLVEHKDYPNLIHAFVRVVAEEPSAILLIVGIGHLRQELEAACRSYGLAAQVVFAGMRSDIPELLSAADIFVLSSAWEGFGLVVAEAMACELVAVATDSGGVREVLGDAGFLVPPGDHEALAVSLLTALRMPEADRQMMGTAARNRVLSLYSMNRAVEKWEQLYQTGNGP